MSSIWDYPDGIALFSGSIVGFDVEALDGHIGTVDAASVVTGRAHLVIDTSRWIVGRKRILPAGVVHHIDEGRREVHVALSKEQIRSAPDFDASRRDERDVYDAYYEPLGRALPDPLKLQRTVLTVEPR